MALNILNCISQVDTNYFIDNCCCNFDCEIFNDGKDSVEINQFNFVANPGWSITGISINNAPISLPFTILGETGISLSFTLCNEGAGFDSINLYMRDSNNIIYSFDFPVQNITLDSLLPTSVNCGTLAVGQSTNVNLPIAKTVQCCADYYFSGLSNPFSIQSFENICHGIGNANVPISFQPTSIGSFNQNLTISFDECTSIQIAVFGNAVEPTKSGNPVDGGKKKIAQSSDSSDCVTKGNFQKCQPFNQTIQKSIQSISRQMPGGGLGRGTKFSK